MAAMKLYQAVGMTWDEGVIPDTYSPVTRVREVDYRVKASRLSVFRWSTSWDSLAPSLFAGTDCEMTRRPRRVCVI